ncbi:MAG: LutB/LldF family L-lactate oxidation iron-sulfur protein [Pseudomonadales bacterium]|nr:LutB/LldF family L-lactate oxidation iron-sulfur protein [Pseudomonadales bacterium]
MKTIDPINTTNPNGFKNQASAALEDTNLQTALQRAKSGFIEKRKKAIHLVDDFEHLKTQAQQAKQSALDNLNHHLALFEKNVVASGGAVHRAKTPAELNQIVLKICQQQNAKLVTKGKSMVSEETHLNAFLEKHGISTAETDLGEYIIQLAKEKPSHIIAPAVHKTRQQVAELFKHNHELGERDLEEIRALVDEARAMLRKAFLLADVGITGANLLVADTGSVAIVTNEGNGDLTATLPKTHIVTASIEKVVANMEDAGKILQVLGRSATGQAMSTYTSFFNGPRRTEDLDGPSAFHVVILDNGRSDILNSKYKDMMRCIKCGACLNHCPVYGAVGGHAYGDVYPGPMGSVLTPLMKGIEQATPLPNASTFCGRCEEVCPMSIPLPELLRQLRNDQATKGLAPKLQSMALGIYGWLARKPRLFQLTMGMFGRVVKLFKVSHILPQETPAPDAPDTFVQQWKKSKQGHSENE